MAASIVQSCHGNAGGGTGTFSTISATWTGNTTAANTVFAIFGFEGSVTGTITFPNASQGNWTGVVEESNSPWTFNPGAGIIATLRVFKLSNAPQQTTGGAQTFTITGSTAGVVLAEASGLGSVATLDSVSAGANPSAIATGNSNGPTTNAMTCTNGATDLYLACFVNGGTAGSAVTFTGATTNGFVNQGQDGAAHGTVPKSNAQVNLTALVGNSGSTSTESLMNTSANWIAILLAYKSVITTTPGQLMMMGVGG